MNIGRHSVRGVLRVTYSPDDGSARHKPQRGFTLVELMIGVLLVSVLLGIGLPLFRSFILEQRLRATTTDLRIALTLARSEAVKRNTVIELKKNAAGWGKGWSIPSPIVGDPDLLTHVQAGDVRITTTPANATVLFSPAGRVAAVVEFEVDIDPASSGTLACFKLATDGRIESDAGACP